MKKKNLFLLILIIVLFVGGFVGMIKTGSDLKVTNLTGEAISVNSHQATFKYSNDKIITQEISSLESQSIKVGEKYQIKVDQTTDKDKYSLIISIVIMCCGFGVFVYRVTNNLNKNNKTINNLNKNNKTNVIIGVDYEIVSENAIKYNHVFINREDGTVKKFISESFTKDWTNAILYIADELTNVDYQTRLLYSQTVFNFFMDGADYDSAYLILSKNSNLSYDKSMMKGHTRFFVEKDTTPTLEELKKLAE